MEENFQLKESICDINSIKDSIIQKKHVPVDLHANLLNALQVIYASNQLLNSINDSISTKYDSNNKEHEDKLLQLWNKVMPNKSLQSRITKQWIEVYIHTHTNISTRYFNVHYRSVSREMIQPPIFVVWEFKA